MLSSLAAVAIVGAALVATATFSTPAYAGGKAEFGCAPSYQLATIGEIDAFSQPLVGTFYTEASLLAFLNTLDRNGDGSLCYAVPPGGLGPPSTSGAARAGFVNLVDDKIVNS